MQVHSYNQLDDLQGCGLVDRGAIAIRQMVKLGNKMWLDYATSRVKLATASIDLISLIFINLHPGALISDRQTHEVAPD